MPNNRSASLKQSLSGASAILMGSVLLSRLLGIVREIVLAKMEGAAGDVDAYVAAFLIPDMINHLLAGGVMSITFIPIFQKRLAAGDEDRAWRSFSNIMTLGTILMLGFIAVGFVFAEQLLGLLGKQVGSGEQLALTVRMTRIMLPQQLFLYWGALFMAVQYARGRFLMPALAPLVYNLGIIAGGVALGPRLGVEGFSWGVLGGAFAGHLVLQFGGALQAGVRYAPRVDVKDADLHRYALTTLPLALGAGLQFSSEIMFRVVGSFLREGSIACLNYAIKVMWALNGLFGQAVGAASYPFLSRLAAENKLDEMDALAHRVLTKIGAAILPCAAVAAALSPQIIGVLFQRGAFTESATRTTARLLSFYLIGSFGFAGGVIVSRCFYALQNTWLPMLVSTAVAVCSIPVYWGLAKTMSAEGVAVAGAVTMTAQFVCVYALWHIRHSTRVQMRLLLGSFGKAALAALIGGGTAWGVRTLLAGATGWSGQTINAAAGGLAGVAGLTAAIAALSILGLANPRAILAAAAVRLGFGRKSAGVCPTVQGGNSSPNQD